MEALKIILEYNYFQIKEIFWHQLIGTAMGTPAAVVGANLVAYLEIQMFRILPQIYPMYFDLIIRTYFRFLGDIIHEWLKSFDIYTNSLMA